MISPSLMCADFFELEKTIRIFEKMKIEYLHIDIMDGHFVPNITLGTDFCRVLKRKTDIPLDIHLMVEKPEEILESFEFGDGDIVSVHAESTCHLQKNLQMIRSRGASPFVALNPATPLSVLDYIKDDIDGVVVMTVNPGFAGQKLISATLDKISDMKKLFAACKMENKLIEVDGNVSFENAVRMKSAGADIFVAGTSSVFTSELSLEDGIKKFRECIGE